MPIKKTTANTHAHTQKKYKKITLTKIKHLLRAFKTFTCLQNSN